VLLWACGHAAAKCVAIIQHHLCSAGQYSSQLQCSITQVDNKPLPAGKTDTKTTGLNMRSKAKALDQGGVKELDLQH
jgi:hypothetical protein